MNDDDILSIARDKFERAQVAEEDTRREGLHDLKFARLGEQWPEVLRRERELEGRPCLTNNRLIAFIRQVVNDARQNKPGIVVYPVDDGADKETAEVINGLIRNIQVVSDADVATDTAIDSAVSNGFGYFRINITDDGKDLKFERIVNPFTVYGDPDSESADGSDWECAFVVSRMRREKFQRVYKGKDEVDWDALGYTGLETPWVDDDGVLVAEYWKREPVELPTVVLSDGNTVSMEDYEVRAMEMAMAGIMPVEQGVEQSFKVTQYILTGAEVLETNEWPGKYIPIVPVYGDEINIEGKRYFRSLINPAKDAQRMHNYWRSMATELVALAPKAPYIGEEGAFDVDPAKWSTANNQSHAYLEFKKGAQRPERQPFAGVPAGALQEALNSADDMKAIVGIYDASLGARSNETSGIAIRARQKEGDVSTFHFIDNLSRAIRHAGRILIDLIPKVYNQARIIRILGEDMKPQNVRIEPGAPPPEEMPEDSRNEAIARVFDVTAGKYDLTVKAGPSYSTLREEARAELVEIISKVPESASILGPMYLRQSDWPGSEEAADKLEQGAGVPPEVQQQMDAMQKEMEGLQKKANDIEAMKAQADMLRAEAELIRAQAEAALAGYQATNPMAEVA